MNLAFVNNTYKSGGAETVAQDLLEGCTAAGHQGRLYVAMGKTFPDDRRVVPMYPRILSRLHHSRMHALVERHLPRAAWTDRQLRRLAFGWPDVVHLHNFHGDYATLETVAFLARRKPLLWTFHAHWGITGGCEHPLTCSRFENSCGECPRLGVWPLTHIDTTAEQLLHKQHTLGGLRLNVISPSRYLADRIRRSRVGRHWKVHHIPNGVSPAAFSPARKHDTAFRRRLGVDPAAVVVLVVNRNFEEPEKGFGMVCEALRAVADTALPLQVVLAGRGSDWAASQLPSSLRPLSLGYVASRDQLSAWFEASDIFLFASAAENFPCTILEAMSSGCCVVSTPTSGVTEQIQDGITGVLARAISGTELARALQISLAEPTRWRALGLAARETASTHFSLDLMIRRHLQLYAALVQAPAALRVQPAAS